MKNKTINSQIDKKEISKYNPSEIEKKWQKVWEDSKTYQPNLDTAKNPFYNLMMFPYPSAEGLHVGNMYAFTGADIYGRFQRMLGQDVFEPFGLDGFGIHSENYAIKVGRTPQEHAKISEENFYRQMHMVGNGIDWSRKLESYDPNYYKWTQWLFTELFKANLAYRKKSPVNFCPSCKTVLADEQVIDNKCERCGTQVEKKDLEQWYFKITRYADRLLTNIENLDWTEKVKTAQRNWIGKKEGIEITYDIVDSSEKVVVFTTRPDTNFGATFIALAPEHPLVEKITTAEYLEEMRKYVHLSQKKTEQERTAEGKEKTGVFTGSYAINQLTGYKMPIWVSDFVLIGFGTGALVGVPGHDKRDFYFAKKFNLEIIRVVVGSDNDRSPIEKVEQVQEEEGTMINSDFLNGLEIHHAKEKIMDFIQEKGYGKRKIEYHLRDWLISRQRYWGAPIPMVYCENCANKGICWFSENNNACPSDWNSTGWFPVPEEELPVLLPILNNWKPTGTGKAPLAQSEEFVNTKCPHCGGPAKRETDVSDTFLDSSWYFFRYTSTERENEAFDIERVKKWLPVNMYIGGAEHSVLHLLYARFITMFLKGKGYTDFDEPFKKFRAHGLLIKDGAKMSKSKGNIIVPDEYIKKFGADTLRTYLMFLGPFSQGGDFSDSGIEGINRFMRRVWKIFANDQGAHEGARLSFDLELRAERPDKRETMINDQSPDEAIIERKMHQTIKKVTDEISSLRYNTAISALMEYYNVLSDFYTKYQILDTKYCKTFVLLLAPFAPHVTEEIWQLMKVNANKNQDVEFKSIHQEMWPKYDEKYLIEDEVVIAVQVMGRLRDTITVELEKSKDQSEVEQIARQSEKVSKHLEDKNVRKVIYVQGKILNFVVE